MKTKMTEAQKIERIAERHADEDWNFYADYSGRCMFGARCPGIVCPSEDVSQVKSAVRKSGIKASASFDNMGRDMIVYWPSISTPRDAELTPDEAEPDLSGGQFGFSDTPAGARRNPSF